MAADATVSFDGDISRFSTAAAKVISSLRSVDAIASNLKGLKNLFSALSVGDFAAAGNVLKGFASSLAGGGALSIAGAAGIALVGVAALNGVIRRLAADAIEADRAHRVLVATIKATGGAAGLSAQQIESFAGELQNVTLFTADMTTAAAGVLTTFRNIQGNVFKEAIELAQDASTVFGSDLRASVLQLGKALNDPIVGLSALTRIGVSFTQQQKDQIRALQESGDLLGAQKIILEEYRKEFGGAAQEAAAGLGVFTRLGNAFGDLFKNIKTIIIAPLLPVFEAILPIVQELASAFGLIADLVKLIVNPIAGLIRKLANDPLIKIFTNLRDLLANLTTTQNAIGRQANQQGDEGPLDTQTAGGIDSLTGLFQRIQGSALKNRTVDLLGQQLAEQKKSNQLLSEGVHGAPRGRLIGVGLFGAQYT